MSYRWLPLAYDNRRSSRRLRLWWILDVEAVSPRGVVDRRVLPADVDARLGLITCVKKRFSQMGSEELNDEKMSGTTRSVL